MYDFVVVGAGSAGCALAYQLSSDPSVKVALIEAGGSDDREAIRVPRQYFSLWETDVDWNYHSTPQPGTRGRVHHLPRGRVLGGTSSINGMVYLRGAKSDYDAWAAQGCTGWDWESVKPLFERIERILQPAVLSPSNPLSAVLVEAAIQAGLPRSQTFDEGTLDGAGFNRSTIVDGIRRSAFRAFIEPVKDRPNLAILPDARALRITMEGRRARGVEVERDGHIETIDAGEVIVSAGAFDSPRLLMASGIGPADHLASLGISVVEDLPVGNNLIDHLLIGIVYSSKRPIADTNAYCTEACAFARSTPDRPHVDLEISFTKEPHFAPDTHDGVPRYTIVPGIVRPKSRGRVRLSSATPGGPLVIDPNYFNDPGDMEAMIAAVRLSRTIGGQDALNDWNGGEFFPGVDVESDEAIADYVRQDVSTWFHPVGTCRMGTGSDAVVDPILRVKGVDGLRVADASIMPDIVSVNTNAASIMIGWKAGNIILGTV